MENTSSRLLKLIIELFQEKNKEKLISLFVDGINDLFHDFSFEWQIEKGYKDSIHLGTKNSSFGYIKYEIKNKKIENDSIEEIKKACEIISVVLENIGLQEANSHRFDVSTRDSNLEKKSDTVALQSLNEELKIVNEELINSKQKAEESEKYITMLFNELPIGLALTEITGELVEVNKEYARIIGYSIEEISTLKYLDITPKKYIELEQVQIKNLENSGEYGPFEKEYIHKSGKLIPARLNGRIVYRDGKKYIWSSVEDISKEKKAKLDFRKQADELILAKEKAENINAGITAIIENTDNSIWSINRKYELIYINNVFKSEFFQSFGIQLAVGVNLVDSLPDTIRSLWKERYDRALNGEKFIFEDKVDVANGVFIFIQVAMNPIVSEGEVIGASFFGSNITARKNEEEELNRAKEQAEKSEEQLRLISDNFVNGMLYQVVAFDDDRREFTYLSEVVTKFYGCTVEEAKVDANLIYGKIHKDDIAQLVEEERDAIKTMSVFKAEARVINPDGSVRWSYFISQPRVIDGNLCWDGIEVDITDRKKQELKFKAAKEKAEESDRLKSEFINNLSHEIRTPMNGIIGFSTFLDNPDLSMERRKQYVSIIRNSGNQLLRVIDDILEISRLETKQVTAQISEVCLNDMLFELFSIFDIRAKQNNLPLYMKKGLANEQSYINTDPSKLRKILSNLIENALKFTNNGFIEFGYATKDNELEIYVKDTGIGIDASKRETIFKRFSQAEKEISLTAGGLGLGLSIAKENTELLGGTIQVESKKGEGTTFFVRIPYNRVVHDNKNDGAVVKAVGHVFKETILIAEDEEINYLYIETLLREILNIKCIILHAKNGQEAIDICKNNNEITLILMDVKMPIVDGFVATREIKNFRPNLPIIAQTAYATPDDVEKAMKVGCDGYLSKPIKIGDFTKVISEYVTSF